MVINMEEIYYNQCIMCDVKTCKFHKENNCTLGKILVNTKNNQTNCASYQKK